MLNFELYNPVRIIFGPSEAENIGKYTKEYGTKAMLVTYDVHDFFNELLAKLDKSFKDAGVTVTEFFKVKPNPRLSDIEEAIRIEMMKEFQTGSFRHRRRSGCNRAPLYPVLQPPVWH